MMSKNEFIVGGYAWSWNSQECSLLKYPGNKMIARAGIAFSNKTTSVAGQADTECLIDTLPALKCSLYYGLRKNPLPKGFFSRRFNDLEIYKREFKDLSDATYRDLKEVYDWEFARFQEELIPFEQFRLIFELNDAVTISGDL